MSARRSHVPEPLRELLVAGLAELGVSEALAMPLEKLARLLARWAARMNLTGHRTPEAIARRLILDALALAAQLPVQPPTSVVDLGSGAGFPGLPIALRWPGCRVTLVEPRERRHHFQRAAVRNLSIANVTPVRGRVEDLAPIAHQVVVAQALAAPERALAWMLPWACRGGWVALARARAAPPFEVPPGLESPRIVPYEVPLGGPRRELWLARLPDAGRVLRRCDTH